MALSEGRLIPAPFKIKKFLQSAPAGGVLLLAFTAVALAWMNSSYHQSYEALFHEPGVLGAPLVHWINDGLMAIFFLFVGLEIKREAVRGELASPKRAAFPIMAALGGVLAPAMIYAGINHGGEGARGWGIPMATDIAFAVGLLALMRKRIPSGITIFVTALAIVDDIAAVLVIALFYTSSLSPTALGGAAVCVAVLAAMNRMGVRRLTPYLLVGAVLWFAVLKSGIHATIAGVLLAMTIPLVGEASPLERLEHGLDRWVALAIMPVFALANAGVRFTGSEGPGLASPVTVGVAAGLFLGKPLGVMLLSKLSVKAGWATLPEGVKWRHVHAAAWLAGIGFTMSLFIATLAFGEGSELLTAAKAGILGASLLAGVVSTLLFLRAGR